MAWQGATFIVDEDGTCQKAEDALSSEARHDMRVYAIVDDYIRDLKNDSNPLNALEYYL